MVGIISSEIRLLRNTPRQLNELFVLSKMISLSIRYQNKKPPYGGLLKVQRGQVVFLSPLRGKVKQNKIKTNVVHYSFSTSSHNWTAVISLSLLVVPYSFSTSSHNHSPSISRMPTLFLILFLHQATTIRRIGCKC